MYGTLYEHQVLEKKYIYPQSRKLLWKRKNSQKSQYHPPCIEAMSCCDEVFDSVGLLTVTFPDDALVFSKKKFSKCDTWKKNLFWIIRHWTDKTVFLTGMEKRAQLKDYRIRSGVVKVSVLLKSKRAILANSFSDLHKKKFGFKRQNDQNYNAV